MKYARGRLAWGVCDRCGQRYPLSELHYQYENGLETSLLVCDSDMDVDHPQLRLSDVDATDGFPLRDPRPDPSLTASRALYAFAPVGSFALAASVGTVEITT